MKFFSLVAPTCYLDDIQQSCHLTCVDDLHFEFSKSFSNVVTLLLNWNTNAKLGSVDGGFVASVVGGGISVDCYGRGVKDGNDGIHEEYW
ncbi:hypothetical protein Tco_1290179 [Tanacetum coccineum]